MLCAAFFTCCLLRGWILLGNGQQLSNHSLTDLNAELASISPTLIEAGSDGWSTPVAVLKQDSCTQSCGSVIAFCTQA